MSKPAIEIQDLAKFYRISHQQKAQYRSLRDDLTALFTRPLSLITGKTQHYEKFWALDKVNFEVQPGEAIGIIGKNGSGKSTLLKILSRITDPSGGRAILRGRVASLLEVGTGFHPELTGRENIYFNGSILGMSKKEIDRKFEEIVDFAGTEKFLDTPVKFYSSGMYVRLAFAIAAHLEPDILIIDEVLAVGDAEFQKKSLGKMSSVASQGRTVLFVSHNMNAVERLCNRAVYLKSGQVQAIGPTSKVIQEYAQGENLSGLSSEWRNQGQEKPDEHFAPQRVAIVDGSGKPIGNRPLAGNEEAWVEIEGEIGSFDPDLTVGYALSNEDGEMLYWSNATDSQPEAWKRLRNGKVKLRSPIPQRFFNEGTYKVELISSLHYKAWINEPGVSSPFVYFTIRGGLSDSPYWTQRRPGILALVREWEIKQ